MKDLGKQLIPARIITKKLRGWVDQESSASNEATDPRYLPFYYWLGRHQPCQKMLYWQMELGLLGASYLLGHQQPPVSVRAIQEPREGYSPRLARSNLKAAYRGPLTLAEEPTSDGWDMVLVDGRWNYPEMLRRLNFIWEWMPVNGVLCVENVRETTTEQVFVDFTMGRACDRIIFPTRYGTGIIRKLV